MSHYEVTQALDGRLPSSLKGWKVAIAIGAAIILAPVVGLVFVFLVATLIPMLPILATLFVRFWLLAQHSTLPSAPVRPPHLLHPGMSHASAP
jgi:hypothetical protein